MAKNTKRISAPKGFKEISGENDGYFHKQEGNSVTGTYLGSAMKKGIKGEEKKQHRVLITDGETEAKVKGGDTVTLSPGEVVALDETAYLRKLTRAGEGEKVWVYCEGKAGPGDKDAWIFRVAIAEANA
jgi:hypothetical protein